VNRPLLVAAGLAVAGLVTWFVVDHAAGPEAPTDARPASRDQTSGRARTDHLPKLEAPAAPDAALPVDAALTAEIVRERGIVGYSEKWTGAVFSPQRWTRVENVEAPTFRDEFKTQITLIVRGGVVKGARVELPPDALSASLTGLSNELVGAFESLPIGFEAADRDEPAIKEGVLERTNGRKLYYRGRLRIGEGEGPWGPEWFVIDTRPLPPVEP